MKAAISENNSQLDKALEQIARFLETISNLQSEINKITEVITDLYLYGDEQQLIERQIQECILNVNKTSDNCNILTKQIQESYTKQQGFIPIDLAEELKSLELAGENMRRVMADSEREFKRAKTVRGEYLNGIEYLHSWVQKAELRIQDRSLDPATQKNVINDIQKEFTIIYEKLDTVKQCAFIIIDKSQSNDEKVLIQSTIDQLEKNVEHIRTNLDERKHLLNDSLDAYVRFLKLYEIVMKWAAEKREFIGISLNVTTLNEARQKMNEYMV